MRQGFGFDETTQLLDYLSELGASHVYLSPPFRAAKGSSHGYDVIDPTRIDDALGGEPARARFLAALRERGLFHIVDVVPNHMSVASDENAWWWDVLENGPDSPHAPMFDVDWEGPTEEARSKVLLPVLTDHYGRALEASQIQVVREPAGFTLNAMGRRLPLSAPSLAPLFSSAAESVQCAELEFLADALTLLGNELDTARRVRHRRVIQARVVALLSENAELSREVDRRIEQLNRDNQALDELIAAQSYRLAHYRIARYDLDYRRFFDIHDLAALSLHRPSVFEKTHALVLDWVRKGEVDGLRIDHPDGLRDPTGYFRRLRGESQELWILAEKILEPGEALPGDWPIHGTTGYDFLNELGGLFVDTKAEGQLSETYREFLGAEAVPDFRAEERASKRFVLDDLLAAELRRLARLFQRVCASKRRHVDFALEELRRALREVIACFPVYRTYINTQSPERAVDQAYVKHAMQTAAAESPDLDAELLAFVEELLSGKCLSDLEWEFAARFQQLSAATMAKGLEDTAFYRYTRLVSLNEVGGDPGRFGTTLSAFHEYTQALQERWPLTMLATTTHDTKRSEDARLRISALSEVPERWAEAVRRWSSRAGAYRKQQWPDPATEYLLWQTLVAGHPLSEQRLQAYLEKAMREAKQHTSWLNQNAEYEGAVLAFARGVLSDSSLMQDVEQFVVAILPIAQRSSLSQTLVKLTACGVPDIYQGSESWDTRLTDPDNRGRVDFDAQRRLLDRALRASPEETLSSAGDGLPKVWLTQRVLALRGKNPEWFGPDARYVPLSARGAEAERIVAYRRGERVIAVAPRLWSGLLESGFGDTELELPSGRYQDWLNPDARYSGRLRVGELLRRFPVALLVLTEAA